VGDPILTISIPTYNRLDLLRQTLDRLLPQLTDEVEVVVCDNCSPDGTADFVRSLHEAGKRISLTRHPANIGPDRNMISCFDQGSGQYVWTLCDDDLPCSNAVESLLGAIRRHGPVGLYYFAAKGSDKNVSDYSDQPVDTGWALHDRDAFARRIGVWVTFASSMVIRRDAFQRDFVERQIGTNVVPAAMVLAAAGRSNCAVIPDKPLLYHRGGNAGGYDAQTVFTKNLHVLLERVRSFGYSDDALRHIFAHSLGTVVPYVITAFPAGWASTYNLFRYGLGYREFYTRVMPALIEAKTGLRRPRWTLGLPTRIARFGSSLTRG
jgi:glycosyltransferase involved in cell wall biosynthesis